MSQNPSIRIISAMALAVSLLSMTSAAHADAKQDAREHYDRALELTDDGQYAEAIVEFNRCYALKPHYAVLYNIAQAYIALARPVEAVDTLKRYLEEGGKGIKDERRKAVQREILRQTVRIATLELQIMPQGATVVIDGRDYGRAPLTSPVRLGLGTHSVAVALEGYTSSETTLDLAGEDHRTIEISLKQLPSSQPIAAAPAAALPPTRMAPAASAAAGPEAQPKPAPNASGPSPAGDAGLKGDPGQVYRSIGIVSAGVGVAAILGGTAAWWVARSKHEDAVNDANNGNRPSAETLQRDATKIMTLANAGFIGGGIVAGTGLLLFLAAPSGSSRPTMPTSRLGLTPSVDRHFIGVAAHSDW